MNGNEEVKMKVCSFLGQKKVYDKCLKIKLKKKINFILSCDNNFIFYFYLKDEFYYLCYTIIKEIQKERSDKVIKMIYVDYKLISNENYYTEGTPPYYMSNINNYDDAFVPPVLEVKTSNFFNGLRVQRWVIIESDYIFYYLYDKISISHNSLLKLLNHEIEKSSVTIIDLTYKSTYLKIKKIISTLSEDLQYVYFQLNEDKNINALSKELNISNAKVFRLYCKCIQSLSILEYKV